MPGLLTPPCRGSLTWEQGSLSRHGLSGLIPGPEGHRHVAPPPARPADIDSGLGSAV